MAPKQNPKEGLSPELRNKLKEVESRVEGRTQIRRVKRLQELQDKLEESHKIEKLKNIEKKVFVPQIFIIIILFPLLIYLNGGSLAPFYVPLFYPLLMLLTWTLILCLELFAFRMLEIKHHPSKSVKYLMAKNSMKKSVTVFIVVILIFSILYLPFLSQEISERGSMEKNIELDGGRAKEVDLASKGRFDFRTMKNLTVELLTKYEKDIVVTLSVYEKETGNTFDPRNLTREDDQVFFDDFSKDEFKELILRLNSTHDSEVRLFLDIKVDSNKIYWLSIITFLYIATFAEWTAVLYPVRKKYSGTGIYH